MTFTISDNVSNLKNNVAKLHKIIKENKNHTDCTCKHYPEYIVRQFKADFKASSAVYDHENELLTINLSQGSDCQITSMDKYNRKKVTVQSKNKNPHEVGGNINEESNLYLLLDGLKTGVVYQKHKLHHDHKENNLSLHLIESEHNNKSGHDKYQHHHAYTVSKLKINEQETILTCHVEHKRHHNVFKEKQLHHSDIKNIIKNNHKTHEHFDINETFFTYNQNIGSPDFFSGCWWQYIALDLVITIMVDIIEAALAVAGEEETIIMEVVFETAEEYFTKLLKDIIIHEISDILKRTDIYQYGSHVANGLKNGAEPKGHIKNAITAAKKVNDTLKAIEDEDMGFLANLLHEGVKNVVKWLVEHKILKVGVPIEIILGAIDFIVDIVKAVINPAADLPSFAARLICLSDGGCWMRDFKETINEDYFYSALIRDNFNKIDCMANNNNCGNIKTPDNT